MWSCDRSNLKSSIVHVLNGDYPEADVKRMSLPGLEKLVARLVQCTGEAGGAAKPKWWPSGIVFRHPLDLGLQDEREVKLALKQLVVNCSQFFRERPKWEWNDENRKARRRPRLGDVKRFQPFVRLCPKVCEPFLPQEERSDAPTKHQFLHYFRLNSTKCKEGQEEKAPVQVAAAKLTNCIHIPFSSDVGRIMAARENHHMPEDIKLKRLERSEWYTNKRIPRTGEVEYEQSSCYKEPGHAHRYKIPKRQQHQKRQSLYSAEFLERFCTPLVVNLERLDLEKVKRERDKMRKELVVMIDKTERLCCDVKSNGTCLRMRASSRLKGV